MKELIIVSKTHLDLGFTDYAETITKKYLTEYIPSAAKIAKALNADGKKRFVWTTGSWLLAAALHSGDENLKTLVTEALKRGDIAPHALPFTTHTELLDRDLFEYGLSLVEEIDAICGRKTTAAKMTDVPGHTGAIVPLLAKHGIKMLHIGVNGASALAKVPGCFLWKFGGAEVVVIYSGDYGGVFKSEFIDDILYLDHTLDNRGTKSEASVKKKVDALQRKYPDYNVRAGRMDDIADALWEVRGRLPVVSDEIGDTWIHGIATDPYKTAAFRRLCALKAKWLAEGSLLRDSAEYRGFASSLLCVAEHTWGVDIKRHFGDMENYLKADFEKARKDDIVHVRHPFVYFPNSFDCFFMQLGKNKKLKYSNAEKSWQEQRKYISDAVSALSAEHKQEATTALSELIPTTFSAKDGKEYTYGSAVTVGKNTLSIDKSGGVKFVMDGKTILDSKNRPLLEYRSYGDADYDFWLKHYTRNYAHTRIWAKGDFARPGIERFDKKFAQGLFAYSAANAKISATDASTNAENSIINTTNAAANAENSVINTTNAAANAENSVINTTNAAANAENSVKSANNSDANAQNSVISAPNNEIEITVELKCDPMLNTELGAPSKTYAVYKLTADGLDVKLLWLKKDAIRTTESIAMRFYPQTESLTFTKLGERINPAKTVSFGGRKLAVSEKTYFTVGNKEYSAVCVEAPLIATDGGNILRIDDRPVTNAEDGLAYVLYDNVWGTNFPLWYEGAAEFNVNFTLSSK